MAFPRSALHRARGKSILGGCDSARGPRSVPRSPRSPTGAPIACPLGTFADKPPAWKRGAAATERGAVTAATLRRERAQRKQCHRCGGTAEGGGPPSLHEQVRVLLPRLCSGSVNEQCDGFRHRAISEIFDILQETRPRAIEVEGRRQRCKPLPELTGRRRCVPPCRPRTFVFGRGRGCQQADHELGRCGVEIGPGPGEGDDGVCVDAIRYRVGPNVGDSSATPPDGQPGCGQKIECRLVVHVHRSPIVRRTSG